MSVEQKTVNGALVFYENGYQDVDRWLDAMGENVIKFLPGIGKPDETTGVHWITTETGTSTMINSVVAGDLYTIVTDTSDFDGVNAQLIGEAFKLEAGKPLYFGAKITAAESTQKDFLIGLCEADTTLTAASSTHAIALGGDGIFFSCLDGSTTIAAKTYLDGAETATANASTAFSTDAIKFDMYWDGSTVTFYINGVAVTSVNSSLPDGDLTPSIVWRDGDGSSGETLVINQFRVIQAR